MYINIYMKKLIILVIFILCLASADRRIVSRPIKSTYNQYGAADSLIIQWKSYQPIYQSDILKLTMSQPIHDSTLIVPFSLYTAHSLSIVTAQNSLSYVGSNQYYLPINTNLTEQIWYELRLTLRKSLTLIYALVQLQIISKATTPYISYAWNNGFEYCHLQQANIPNLNIFSLSINSSFSTLSTSAADRYLVLLEISSSITVNQPVNVTFQFYNFNPNTINITTNTTVSPGSNNGFIFVGSCFSRCDYQDTYHTCIHSSQCVLNTKSIVISLPYLRANQIYLVQTYVVNPPYISNVSIQAYWKDNSGTTMALAFSNQILSVSPIIVQAQQIRLLWDIPYNTVVNQMGLGLIVNDPAVQHQSLASFDIGFSVSDVTPIEGQYQVIITVGASSVLQNSINHNLPNLKTTTKISCKYIKPDIICTNVDAFTLKNFRFYVRARGYFLTIDSLTSFGNVAIIALGQPNNLFINLVRGLTVKTIVNADYHDYGGLHQGSSNYRIGQTMVISHNDTLNPNSTSKSLQDFLYNPSSLVGVDTSVSPQQLLFLLKVGLNQMSLPTPSIYAQNYTMKVFTNPNIMNVSNLGIDFQAYSAANQYWDVADAPCYVDSSTTPTMQFYSCQKYNDHVYNRQIDNTYVQTAKYGLYTSVCGNGQVVVCPTTDCSTRCQIFRGGFNSVSMGTGTAGVLSIRDVKFIDSYQSPIQAGPYNFDFVLAFYHAGTLVSSSLINAYTVNKTRLQNVRADLINYYHDSTLTNFGSRLPTLLKISGHLTLQQAGRRIINSIRVHMPSLLGIANFVQTLNANNYGCSTAKCTASTGGLTKLTDTWVSQNTVQISNLPSLTQRFKFLFPVVYTTPSQFLEVTLSFIQNDGRVAGVYRINGSSVSQLLVGNINYIALPWTPVNPWLTTLSEWTNQPTLHSFKQSIDLSAIIPFAPSNTINMGATVMPTVDASPSTTFSTAYLNIFSNFSYPLVDNSVSCVDPFGYTYMNTYKVWTLWCPVQPGSLNQIKFNFPLYPDVLGTSFPYSLIFAYSYANTAGRMIGYRTQQNAGGSPQTCTTQKITNYNVNSPTPQQNIFSISLSPFTVTPALKNKFMLVLTIPTQIPISLISCAAKQSSLNTPLTCNILNQASNVFKMQIIYTGTVDLQIYSLILTTKSVRSAASTIASIQQFSINMYLPYTDGAGLPSFVGNNYTPFSSLFASCNNSFSYSSVSSQQYIYLNNPLLTAPSSGYYGTVAFQSIFSSTRTTFFSTSQLVITFSQAILNPYSRCQFTPNTHFFFTSTIDATNKILTLAPTQDIPYFTQTPYSVICSKIISNGNNITITMLWKDGTYNIQTTFTPIVAIHNDINSITSTITTTIANKYYNTPGYLGQYHLTLNLATVLNENVKLYIDFGMNYVYQNFVQAYYGIGTSWKQILVFSTSTDVQSEIYAQFVAVTASSIQLRIYGILQHQINTSLIKILVIKKNMATGVSTYYTSSLNDMATVSLTTPPIIIYSFDIDYTSTLRLNYSLPVAYSGSFYVRFDELFRMPPTISFTCLLNTTVVPCTRTRPDLLLISSTLSQSLNFITQLTVYNLSYYYNQIYDTQQVHFSLFIPGSALAAITYSSHQHLQNELLTSSLLPPQTLIWRIPKNIYRSVVQIVYVGYYGPPVKLILSTLSSFKQSFSYNYTSPVIYEIQDMKAWLGTTADAAYIGTFNTASYGYQNLIFSQNSSYTNIASLPIYVSAQKCSLKAQFSFYNIVSGGVTIPIAINISACRPMDTMTVSTAINSPYIFADQSLTTKTINITTQIIYIVLNHQSVTGTQGQSYSLQVTLSSLNPIVQNAFNIIPNITITVVDRSLLIGNPQAKQPVINYLTQNSAQFNLQCNTPATIYWGIGIYPTMLGITVEQISARLVDKSNGLVRESVDIYSWSHEQYGLSYVNDFNIQNNVTVYGLQGGLDYVFKYYCVDQTGTASGGKISLITTLPSNYSLMKISLSFSQKLTHHQVNTIACTLSQQLIIPYNDTISSVHSNCLNNTQIYYKHNQTYYDQLTTLTTNYKLYPYTYFFYIHTIQATTFNITYTLANKLSNNNIFINNIVPYYGIIRSDSLYNNYKPVVYKMSLDIRRNSFKINVDVGLTNSYLITAIMDKHFDPRTMSLPSTYLMKMGYFSLNDQFDQIFSIYGTQRLSATFANLQEGMQLSVFYYVTVDNSALNSRSTQVYYQNLVTNKRQIVDLMAHNLSILVLGIIGLIFIGF